MPAYLFCQQQTIIPIVNISDLVIEYFISYFDVEFEFEVNNYRNTGTFRKRKDDIIARSPIKGKYKCQSIRNNKNSNCIFLLSFEMRSL